MSAKADFFQVGATLDEDAPSYVERSADIELLKALERGELCLVLAPRQTGKSSLVVHARVRLKRMGIAAGIVDLQPLGSHGAADAWFSDVVYQVERSLGLQTDTLQWWEAHRRLGPTQRFMVFIEDVVLGEIKDRAVIFFDEIDSLLPLPFSDDFFTTIRALVNARAANPTLKRVTFVLVGVATPSDFVKSRSRTPFNIGTEIELKDFDPGSLSAFRDVLGVGSEPIVDRIFYWTDGQPLMVQKLAQAAHALPGADRTIERVDAAVRGAYLDARIEKDTHLKFVRDYLLDSRRLRKTLKTYQTALREKAVPYNDQSPVHSRLKLAGVVRVDGRNLVPRNRVYQDVFDLSWVKANRPRDVTKMVAYGASFSLLLVLLWFLLLQPLFSPRFSPLQGIGGLLYTEESTVRVNIPLPGAEISRGTLNGRDVALPGSGSEPKAGGLSIPLENLPVGVSEHRLRLYGGLWKENFEAVLQVVSFPPAYWKPLANLEMVTVPAGCFDMGCGSWDGQCETDELPVHRVCLDGFQVGKHEVTQDQWERVMGHNPSYFNKGGRYPVEGVSWADAQEFIRRLNKLTGDRFRLPTEAEWEYAARSGGKAEKYSGGGDPDAVAWYSANSGGGTRPVGQKAPNGLGLHDMSGNVWEWCQDWYGGDYYKNSPEKNPKGPENGSYRVFRGGSWFNIAAICRSAYRSSDWPDYRGGGLGFRLSRSVAHGP